MKKKIFLKFLSYLTLGKKWGVTREHLSNPFPELVMPQR